MSFDIPIKVHLTEDMSDRFSRLLEFAIGNRVFTHRLDHCLYSIASVRPDGMVILMDAEPNGYRACVYDGKPADPNDLSDTGSPLRPF